MYQYLCDRNKHYYRSVLFFLVICILVACTAYEKPDLEKLPYSGANGVNAITSLGNGVYDIVACESTDFSIIKNVIPRNSEKGRFTGFRTATSCTVIIYLFILISTCVLFLVCSERNLVTSHHFIITYIHNLDGMKP